MAQTYAYSSMRLTPHTLQATVLLLLVAITGMNCDGGHPGDSSNENTYTGGCLCTNLEDTVQDSACVRNDISCNALTPCDQGYACDSSHRCVCVDQDVCGIICSSQCSCPTATDCDLPTGTCRERLHCLDNSMCPDGQQCRLVEPYHYVCVVPAGATTGEACQKHEECLSNLCVENECIQACRRNDDCPQGLLCLAEQSQTPGCYDVTPCGNCAEPGQFCSSGGQCKQSCHTSVECPAFCDVSPDSPLISFCNDWPEASCGDDEFFVLDPNASEEHYCVIYVACWHNEDCPSGYDCVSGTEFLSFRLGETGLCARVEPFP